jgi:hypothetical protein
MALPGMAQLHLRGLPYAAKTDNARVADINDSTQLTLPYWDDFSSSEALVDTADRWTHNSVNATVKSGISIEAPSINVAVFDGWDAFGQPYSEDALAEGVGDSLVSKFINLATLTNFERNTTYLSFFYQKEGLGDIPESRDSIYLQFRTADNEWETVWSVNGSDVVEGQFYQEIIKLDSNDYFHEYFQFRFQSFGRLAGGFDSWLIDYVYLNKGRNNNDLVYDDATIATPPSSFIKGYTALPMVQFRQDPAAYMDSTFMEIVNLLDERTPYVLSTVLLNAVTGDTIQQIGKPQPDANLEPLQRQTVFSLLPDASFFDTSVDSIWVEVVGNLLGTVDTLITDDGPSAIFYENNVVRKVYKIDQELAYDDGTAEFALGTNGRGSELAYRFIIPESDELTGVKIYFPEFDEGTGGAPFTIKVWRNLDGLEESVITEEPFLVKASANFNELQLYEFSKAVSLIDTFYIGFEQETDGFFTVGYDRNTSSGQNIFFKTGPGGDWQPNEGRFPGSLMIRPYFGREGVIGLEEDQMILEEVRVYPNPVSDWLLVEGRFDQLMLYDLTGKQWPLSYLNDNDPEPLELDLSGLPMGVYLLQIVKGEALKSIKLIKN